MASKKILTRYLKEAVDPASDFHVKSVVKLVREETRGARKHLTILACISGSARERCHRQEVRISKAPTGTRWRLEALGR
jgi:hypothetical protein